MNRGSAHSRGRTAPVRAHCMYIASRAWWRLCKAPRVAGGAHLGAHGAGSGLLKGEHGGRRAGKGEWALPRGPRESEEVGGGAAFHAARVTRHLTGACSQSIARSPAGLHEEHRAFVASGKPCAARVAGPPALHGAVPARWRVLGLAAPLADVGAPHPTPQYLLPLQGKTLESQTKTRLHEPLCHYPFFWLAARGYRASSQPAAPLPPRGRSAATAPAREAYCPMVL